MVHHTYLTFGGILLALAISLPPAPPTRAEPASSVGVVRVGLAGSLFRDKPESIVRLMVQPFQLLLESQTGVKSEVEIIADADDLAKQLKDGHLQLGVFQGVELARERCDVPELKPLLIAVNRQHYLRAMLVVRKDCRAASAADIGGPIALPRFSREHCRLFLERHCPRTCCSGDLAARYVTACDDVEAALNDVVDSKVMGAVVDSTALESYAKLRPGRFANLRVLQQSERFPCSVIAYVAGALPEGLLGKFCEGMVRANESVRGQQLLELCRITRFESVPPDYEQVLADIAKAYPRPIVK
jgi:ABC-type phosphate/phosphonate transport system substrate-binding protein